MASSSHHGVGTEAEGTIQHYPVVPIFSSRQSALLRHLVNEPESTDFPPRSELNTPPRSPGAHADEARVILQHLGLGSPTPGSPLSLHPDYPAGHDIFITPPTTPHILPSTSPVLGSLSPGINSFRVHAPVHSEAAVPPVDPPSPVPTPIMPPDSRLVVLPPLPPIISGGFRLGVQGLPDGWQHIYSIDVVALCLSQGPTLSAVPYCIN